jgi:hypothetical protein
MLSSTPLQGSAPEITSNEVRQFLPKIPPTIVWNCGEVIYRLRQSLGVNFNPTPDWFDDLIRYLLEYIADFYTSEWGLNEYAQQICNEFDAAELPLSPQAFHATILSAGKAMRDSLNALGLYDYKGALLYRFSAFDGWDIWLERLDKDELPWLESKPPGEPGSRGRFVGTS